jgi:competence protein ComEC
VRVLIPFICGIVLALSFAINFLSLTIALVIALAIVIGTHLALRYSSRYYFYQGVSLSLLFAFCGMTATKIQQHNYNQQLASVREKVPVAVTLTGDPEIHNNNVRSKAHVFAILVDSVWQEADADIMIYIKRNPAAEMLRYGHQLTVAGGLQEPVPPMNPGEFDYKNWLRNQGIGFVCFARNDWKKTGEEYPSLLKHYALELRNYFTARMKLAGLSGQELAVSEALLLGKSNEIDPNLLASYSASGTLHVLSVSGMHVALLFVVLLKLLAPLEKRKNGKLISYAIQFIVIWFYAFLTGMSPSVLRSVMMLSVIIFGNIIHRKGHLLNTLAASALLLLIFDPLLIRNAGFLLSYAAVAGIVIGVPILEPLFVPRNRVTRWIWDITTVTIAAQLFTFPLGLVLFQQFPTWFLFTNLIIIPLSTICLYAGLLLLCISWWTWGVILYAHLFALLISFLNWMVALTEYLPYAVIRTASWTTAEIGIVYAIVILLLASLAFRKRMQWIFSGAAALSLIIVTAFNHFQFKHSGFLTVYHLEDGVAIGYRNGLAARILISEHAAANPDQIDFHVTPDFRQYGIYDADVMKLSEEKDTIVINERVFWLGARNKEDTTQHRVNYMIISEDNCRDTSMLRYVKCDTIILAGRIKQYYTGKWTAAASSNHIPILLTAKNGSVQLFSE